MQSYILPLLLVAALAGCSKPSVEQPTTAAVAPVARQKAPLPELAKPPTSAQISQSLVTKYDVNHDGAVTTEEVRDTVVGNLLKASKTHESFLNAAEFHSALGDETGKDADIQKTFAKVDTNKDNKLDVKELTDFVWPSISALNQPNNKTNKAQ